MKPQLLDDIRNFAYSGRAGTAGPMMADLLDEVDAMTKRVKELSRILVWAMAWEAEEYGDTPEAVWISAARAALLTPDAGTKP